MIKIAVATDDNISVAGHVGRCKAFIVYEADDTKIISKEVRINSFTNHSQHNHNEEHHQHQGGAGHGQHSHHNLIDGLKDCEALIFSSGGWRLVEDLKLNNIKPILTEEKLADDAAQKYLNGNLVINEANVCSGHQH